jgi:predicted dehydrogenase
MWTRFLPVTEQVREWLRQGEIGDVRILRVDLGFRTDWMPDGRLLNPELAGGALLDVGVYPVAYASMVFGKAPESVQAWGHIGASNVDEQTGMIFGYPGGAMAMLSCAIRTRTGNAVDIYGTEGSIHVDSVLESAKARLCISGLDSVEFGAPIGFSYEANEVMRCLRAGERESRLLPLEESIAIAETMNRMREQIGLRYPMER